MSLESHMLETSCLRENPAYLKPIHIYAYRRPDGELPVIEGIVLYSNHNVRECPCFKVRYKDGFVDYVNIDSLGAGHYKIVSEDH